MKMNQLNPANNSDALQNIPVKRKRGRPRKDKTLNRVEVTRMPPGFEGFNGNQPHQLDAIEHTNDGIVGQAVTGVVEAAFDAGYLLTVRIGNSNTSLSGVVFKPGHYVPISTEIDVAPHVQIVRRNEKIPFPMENQTHRRRRSKVRKEQQLGTGHFVNGLVPLVGSRGTVVPVVLQPVNLSNGLLNANQLPPVPFQPGHTVPANHNHLPKVDSQLPPPQPQNSSHITPVDLENENGSIGKSSAEDSGSRLEGDSCNVNGPLVVEPLQVIHSNIRSQSEPVPHPSQNMGIGRMTALLQAVQENMTREPGS